VDPSNTRQTSYATPHGQLGPDHHTKSRGGAGPQVTQTLSVRTGVTRSTPENRGSTLGRLSERCCFAWGRHGGLRGIDGVGVHDGQGLL
jgi:hypothetical protein